MKNTTHYLVTISIPTYNSANFLPLCLDAIKKQTYPSIEVNIIDGGSRDETITIAKKWGVKHLYVWKGSLMKARHIGAENAKGKYVVLLDSDQILEKDTIERSVSMIQRKDLDMLVLEEDVYNNKTFTEKLFHLDRKFVHSVMDLDPNTSVLLPRFYKRSLLLKAYYQVPEEVINQATPQDHAILYLESWKLSKKIAMLPNAVKHIEPSDIKSMMKKYFRWGYFSVSYTPTKYDSFFSKRTERLRKGMFRKDMIKESLASLLLLLLKGIPYKSGFVIAQFRKKFRDKRV
jgi:glycosyltransferase involved in cell wall biosynthesis